jgi:manganese/zinc/iron transport system substrate-binding protein
MGGRMTRRDGRPSHRGRTAGAARLLLLLRAAAVLMLLPACDAADSEGDARLRVVATTGMIADAAARIGGPDVVVHGLMGPGVDPHGYKARPGDVRRLAAAELVLYNGLHLEAAMEEVLEGMRRRTMSVAVTEWIPASALIRPPEFEGAQDPHVWFDVRLWTHVVRRVGAALSAADPGRAAEYAEREAAYVAELEALDGWIRGRIASLPEGRRVLVTAHDAFNYFGRAYGVEVLALQGISTAAEAGTADVQRLADVLARRRIPAVFVETSVPVRMIQAVQAAASARGHRVEVGRPLYSDALGAGDTPAGTYVGMVRHNVEAIVQALGTGGEG